MVFSCSYHVGLICNQIKSRISLSSRIIRGWILTNLCSCFCKTTPGVNLTENMHGNLLRSRCQFLQAKRQCEPRATPNNLQHSSQQKQLKIRDLAKLDDLSSFNGNVNRITLHLIIGAWRWNIMKKKTTNEWLWCISYTKLFSGSCKCAVISRQSKVIEWINRPISICKTYWKSSQDLSIKSVLATLPAHYFVVSYSVLHT